MLALLKIRNIALIDAVEIEFGSGLNLLTGETGSGKSIIVDSLGALTGERVSTDLIKDGVDTARIEGIFSLDASPELRSVLDEGGIEIDGESEIDLIVRRDISNQGKNRIFINDQLVTQSLLKKIGAFLVDIHGQGEQASLFDPANHLEMLDEFAVLGEFRKTVAEAFRHWSRTKTELGMLEQNEAEKLQMLDILRFQADEIGRADLKHGEIEELEEEKLRLNNVEKLSSLTDDAYKLLYENDESTIATLEKAARKIDELAGYESKLAEYQEGLKTAQTVIGDLAITVRDFRNHLEFSPERLEEIENRLAEISRVMRKYGGTVETALSHLAESNERIANIETAEFREQELRKELEARRSEYIKEAGELSRRRISAAKKFEKEVESNLKAVALEKAKFEVRIESSDDSDKSFAAKGFNHIEFFFSANVGESPKPLAKVASGGEASRLMLVLKTAAKMKDGEKAAVFDEIDAGIGGRVAEAVGLKLKLLAKTQQVLCVTHQAQVASLADTHLVVEKTMTARSTSIEVRVLNADERIEEIARMLAGETITETARQHAREMISATRELGETAAG
jgi:DNA repair protein RecN (Recombination protein N)